MMMVAPSGEQIKLLKRYTWKVESTQGAKELQKIVKYGKNIEEKIEKKNPCSSCAQLISRELIPGTYQESKYRVSRTITNKHKSL